MSDRIDRRGWSPEERSEEEAMWQDIVDSTTDTHARLDYAEERLNGAIQAHRHWAYELERQFLRNGLAKEIKRYQDRHRALVAYHGRTLNVPRVQGVKSRRPDGTVFEQRALIEMRPWEEIAAKRLEAIRSRRTYTEKIAHYDKLLALREMAPDTATPFEAATALGLSLDEYLGTEGAA